MNDTLVGYIIGCILGVSITAFCVHQGESDAWKKDAIKHGKAEYYLDEKHERQWRWLP